MSRAHPDWDAGSECMDVDVRSHDRTAWGSAYLKDAVAISIHPKADEGVCS